MNQKFLKYYEQYMNVMGPLANVMFFLQAYKIFDCKNALSISIPGFILSLVGLISWLLYGIFIKNTALILSNSTGMIGAILVLIGTFMYI